MKNYWYLFSHSLSCHWIVAICFDFTLPKNSSAAEHTPWNKSSPVWIHCTSPTFMSLLPSQEFLLLLSLNFLETFFNYMFEIMWRTLMIWESLVAEQAGAFQWDFNWAKQNNAVYRWDELVDNSRGWASFCWKLRRNWVFLKAFKKQ